MRSFLRVQQREREVLPLRRRRLQFPKRHYSFCAEAQNKTALDVQNLFEIRFDGSDAKFIFIVTAN